MCFKKKKKKKKTKPSCQLSNAMNVDYEIIMIKVIHKNKKDTLFFYWTILDLCR